MTPLEIALKKAIERAIAFNGGVDATASLVGMSAKSMSRFQTNEHPKCSPSLFKAIRIDERGNDEILKCWADARGWKLTPKTIKKSGRKNITQILGLLSKEHGDVMRTALEYNAKGEFSPAEAIEVLNEVEEEQAVLGTLRGLCLAKIQEVAE